MSLTAALPRRWYPLHPYPAQMAYADSPARFNVVAAGRRSGKTERAKRKLIMACLRPPVEQATYIVAAPTYTQCKKIYWDDLVALSPRWALQGPPSLSELTIRFITGARLILVGLDKPQRIEGIAIDGGVLDEYAECKPEAWTMSIRPALSTPNRPPGWMDFIGRPRGRNHFHERFHEALHLEDWAAHHWTSEEVLAPEEIRAAKRDLDELTYRQEYLADWVDFTGRAYYAFERAVHCKPLGYDPALPLVFCLDFNVEPGSAVVLQEQMVEDRPEQCGRCGHKAPGKTGEGCPMCHTVVPPATATCCLGEVHIPRNSNTPAVANRLAADWGHHKGEVHLYGDPTGGNRHTQGVHGSDWDLVEQFLDPHFRGRVYNLRAHRTPPERARVSSLNKRCRNAAGEVRLFVDAEACPELVKDLEGVVLLEGGTGEIDKKADLKRTHWSDALGYYTHRVHGLSDGGFIEKPA